MATRTLSDRLRHLWRDERGFIGTTAAIIGGALAAGGALGSAAIQARAAGKARNLQERGADRARTIQQPYVDAGTGALTTLRGLTGQPQPPMSYAPPPQQAVPRNLSQMGRALPSGRGPGALTTVRAPTGETRQVPASQTGYWQSRGAQVVQ